MTYDCQSTCHYVESCNGIESGACDSNTRTPLTIADQNVYAKLLVSVLS